MYSNLAYLRHQTWNICGDCVCVGALAVGNNARIVVHSSSFSGVLHNQDVVVVHIAAVCDNLHGFKVSTSCSDIFPITHPSNTCWRRVRCTACNSHESICALIINEIIVFTGVYSRRPCIQLALKDIKTLLPNHKN